MEILKKSVSPNLYEKILNSNINSVSSLLLKSNVYLQQYFNLTSLEVTHLRSALSHSLLQRKFTPASDVHSWLRLTTGCQAVDSVTSGGIPVNGITEIVGPSGVGKTQLCLQLAITVQLPVSLGGLHKGAIYICTEDLFPSKRLHQLATCFSDYNIDVHTIMNNVFLEHISDYEQLRRCCQIRIPMLLLKHKIGLIVIDSIAGTFRSETAGVNYAHRSREFNTIASSLNKLCSKYGIAIVVTNQVVDNGTTGRSEPCLGLAWSNLITCRFWISRRLEGIRNFEVVFAPDLPNKTSQFVITGNGVKGVG